MKKANKYLSILLVLIMVVSIIPMSNITASAVDTNVIKQKVVNTHKACLSKTGRTSFNGYCGLYVQTQLSVLGIGNYTAWNGKDWYGNIADGSKSNGYTVKKYSGYNALNTLINNHGSEIYNVVMCYPQQYGASASSPGYGHVMFIHAVVNGYVYFSESYSATNEPEGSAVVLSVSAFNSRYNSWYGNAQGCIWFNNNSVATTSITLNSSPFTLKVGESKTLSATVSPSNATNKTVTWNSNDTSVATVSSSGVVKAVGTGACAITAKASGGQTSSVVIIVRNENPAPVAYATYNGHYYELYDDVLSWKDAKEYCESKGGHLVTITTQEENSFVQSFASNSEKEHIYIGTTDEATEGTWKWVTGESFSYSNFGDGEPSETEYDVEDYVRLSSSTGKWHDVRDITGSVGSCGFICEYETSFKPDAVTVIDGKVYELYDREYPITLAEDFANDKNGDLLTINSEEEQNAVVSWIQANSSTKYVALGAYADTNRVWHWSNGDDWNYDNWRSGEPNNTNNLEDGATIVLGDYGWNDVTRTNAYVFVVEYSLEDWEKDNNEPDTPNTPDTEFVFSIKQPSRTSIRNKDGIVIYSNIKGNAPIGSYVDWSWNNSKFDVEKNSDGTLTIISENNGKTIFTATLYSADGEILATDTIEMQSKAGFFDKIGGFFRGLFGLTKIYDK